MTIFASVIDKKLHRDTYIDPWNPYQISLLFCMEPFLLILHEQGQKGKMAHIVFESRGRKEDKELELEFRRIADNASSLPSWRDFTKFKFEPVFMPKAANSTGLQLADLIARPIGLSKLRPHQSNRAFDIIKPKIKQIKYFP